MSDRKLITASPQAQQAHANRARKGQIPRPFSDEELAHLRTKVRAAKADAQAKLEPSLAAPNDFRLVKEAYGWETREHVGGQRSHRPTSVLDTELSIGTVYAKHFSHAEKRIWNLLITDAETATRVNVICQRAYNGMPYTGSDEKAGHISQGQREAHERFNYARKRTHPGIWKVVELGILGARIERLGRPMTLWEIGQRITQYQGKDTPAAAAVGACKVALLAVMEKYHDWLVEYRQRKESAEATRSAYEHGRAVERWEQQSSKKR